MSFVDDKGRDNPRQSMINCQLNYSDSSDKRSEWRMIASVQGNQEGCIIPQLELCRQDRSSERMSLIHASARGTQKTGWRGR
jgi:hypothetical protein